MQLTIEQKSIVLSWMKTKPFFLGLIEKFGEEKALAYYLKDKSEKRLQYILYHLGRAARNQFKDSKYKNRYSAM